MAAAPPPLPTKSSSVSSFRSSTLPLPKHRAPPSAAVRPLTQAPPTVQATPPKLLRPKTVTAASICSLYTSGGGGAKYQPGHGTLPRSRPRAKSREFCFRGEVESISVLTQRDEEEEACCPRPLSPTKLLPFLSGGGGLRAGLLNAPRPLKKRSSLCEPDNGPQLLRVRNQRTTQTLQDHHRTILNSQDHHRTTLTSQDHEWATHNSQDHERTTQTSLDYWRTTQTLQDHERITQTKEDHPRTVLTSVNNPTTTQTSEDHQRTSLTSLNGTVEMKNFPKTEVSKVESPVSLTPPPLPPRIPITDSTHRHLLTPATPTEQQTLLKQRSPQLKALKSVLRAPGSVRSGAGLRVWFNPVCLLLDSALEGEFDLVQRVIYEVSDPSAANDEGITALHNAVCAGHSDIVRFLVQFGVNVNAADSDGWTPLHCAASCNNTALCQLLVQSGAAVFAQTHSDSQTPADKCEEQDPDYKECSQFLYGVQEKMGVMNRGQVFALWSFEPEDPDELQISEGDCVTVLDQAQRSDTLWWWVRGGDCEGYVPRNLLGLYPRIKPRQRSLA